MELADDNLESGHLKEVVPVVHCPFTLKAKWVVPDYWVSQFFIGHGGFRAKLHEFWKNTELFPSYTILESAEHIITDHF